MHGLARHVFTICSAISLLLYAAVLTVWVRSATRTDALEWVREPSGGVGRHVYVHSHRGRLIFEALTSGPLDSASSEPHARLVWNVGWGVPQVPSRVAGIGWTAQPYGPASWGGSFGFKRVAVPHLAFAGVAAVLPISWFFIAWRRARRQDAAGLCPACGYDLRATPQQCPECGRT